MVRSLLTRTGMNSPKRDSARGVAGVESLQGKTAVVTGGASGMGRAFAGRFGQAGMNVVIGDIEQGALDLAVEELRAEGANAIGLRTDVSLESDMRALADRALAEFGQVNVVCLNAGVAGGNGPIETLTAADWQWTFGVNLWGIVHGIGAFLPHLKQHDDGHIVITASIAGLTSFPGAAPYNTTKHAAVAIAETMFSELRDAGSSVGVSCLCPGIVRTRIIESERNRPEELRRPHLPAEPTAEQAQMHQVVMDVFGQAKPPSEVAELVHDAVLAKQFWIFTDDVYTPAIHERLESIRTASDPPARGSLMDVYFR
jgi:NAD(P)-dependent dehydrogenase (short-subunit alcohol dehydrogenase family)